MLASLTRNAVRGCCVIAAGLLVLAAQAQPAWKLSRAVTIIDPIAPGGGTEVTARAIAQPVKVDSVRSILWQAGLEPVVNTPPNSRSRGRTGAQPR
jgi:tripartite-type tricarboxylate transporter receptor subunit TctC